MEILAKCPYDSHTDTGDTEATREVAHKLAPPEAAAEAKAEAVAADCQPKKYNNFKLWWHSRCVRRDRECGETFNPCSLEYWEHVEQELRALCPEELHELQQIMLAETQAAKSEEQARRAIEDGVLAAAAAGAAGPQGFGPDPASSELGQDDGTQALRVVFPPTAQRTKHQELVPLSVSMYDAFCQHVEREELHAQQARQANRQPRPPPPRRTSRKAAVGVRVHHQRYRAQLDGYARDEGDVPSHVIYPKAVCWRDLCCSAVTRPQWMLLQTARNHVSKAVKLGGGAASCKDLQTLAAWEVLQAGGPADGPGDPGPAVQMHFALIIDCLGAGIAGVVMPTCALQEMAPAARMPTPAPGALAGTRLRMATQPCIACAAEHMAHCLRRQSMCGALTHHLTETWLANLFHATAGRIQKVSLSLLAFEWKTVTELVVTSVKVVVGSVQLSDFVPAAPAPAPAADCEDGSEDGEVDFLQGLCHNRPGPRPQAQPAQPGPRPRRRHRHDGNAVVIDENSNFIQAAPVVCNCASAAHSRLVN